MSQFQDDTSKNSEKELAEASRRFNVRLFDWTPFLFYI